jgi:predicted O-methyltransferase YrrM
VVWHVELSEQTGRGWSHPVDLVFIDGDHAEEATRTDWELWHRHVVPGGHVAFHDARASQAGASACPARPRWSTSSSAGRRRSTAGRSPPEVDRTVAVRRAPAE